MGMTRRGKAGSLLILLAAEVGAMAVWFSSAAVVALLRQDPTVPPGAAGWLTSGVQAGFALGTAASAALSLADRYDPRRLFRVSAFVAAASTAVLAVLPPVGVVPVLLRILTGACMAGVYPVGMRIAAGWATPAHAGLGVGSGGGSGAGSGGGRGGGRGDLGLLIGLLVGALTLGSASPHLLAAVPDVGWRGVYLVSAGLAAAAGVGIGFAALGPSMGRAARVDLGRMAAAWRLRPLRLANLGYLGHMWELYAMWAWLGVFLQSSFRASGMAAADGWAEAAAFAAVAVGALGAWGGGVLADRVGRTTVTMAAMAVSAVCALGIGWLHRGPAWALVGVALVWGVSVIADSAQFSASIAELSPPDAVGTLLTAQTCAGFVLTLVSIQAVPVIERVLGWPGAFGMLAVGPLLGCWAMQALRRDPASVRLAGGRR